MQSTEEKIARKGWGKSNKSGERYNFELDPEPGICTYALLEPLITLMLSDLVSHVMMRIWIEPLERKRVKIKESNLQSVSYFKSSLFFFCREYDS